MISLMCLVFLVMKLDLSVLVFAVDLLCISQCSSSVVVFRF